MRRKRRNSSFRVSTVQTPTRRQPPGICHTSFSLLNRNLYIAYLLKEKFREVFRSKDENEATLCLIPLDQNVHEKRSEPVETLCQGHFMRLQRLHKTSHDYYQQI